MIHIPEPCSADWQGMTPQKDGRFCGSCEKVVVDFTRMTDEDINMYFASYAEQKTCGRFAGTQLNRPLNEKASSLLVLYNRIQLGAQRSFFTQTTLFILSGMLWLSGCADRRTTGESGITNDSMTVSCDSSQPHTLMGAVLNPIPADSSKKIQAQPDTSGTLRIVPDSMVELGEVYLKPSSEKN